MSRQINQKKEAFLASVGPWSAGIAVPYAGVSFLNPARGSTEGQIECSSPEPYAPVVGVEPAYPVRERSDNTLLIVGLPLCTGSGLPGTAYHIFHGMTRQPQDSCISLSYTPASADIGAPFGGVIFIRTALALKSGRNHYNRGFDICNPGRPFFDLLTQTIYAAVLRSVSAYGNSDGKDSLYGSAETFAPRPGFNGLKKTAAQLITDTVPASPTSPQDCCRTSGTVSALTFPARRPNAGAGRAAAAYNVRSRVLTTAKRSSAATCADYTCFPAGSRRRTSFLRLPAPLCGVRHPIPVRRKGASLTQVYSPGRFRVGRRRVQSLLHTVGSGSVFVVSLPKSGVVKPGFF